MMSKTIKYIDISGTFYNKENVEKAHLKYAETKGWFYIPFKSELSKKYKDVTGWWYKITEPPKFIKGAVCTSGTDNKNDMIRYTGYRKISEFGIFNNPFQTFNNLRKKSDVKFNLKLGDFDIATLTIYNKDYSESYETQNKNIHRYISKTYQIKYDELNRLYFTLIMLLYCDYEEIYM